jgi:hypothetical protein
MSNNPLPTPNTTPNLLPNNLLHKFNNLLLASLPRLLLFVLNHPLLADSSLLNPLQDSAKGVVVSNITKFINTL